jgi:hypothetical protein
LVSPAWYVAVDSFATNPVNDEIWYIKVRSSVWLWT